MKIGFVTSTGGHLVQLTQLRSWWVEHERFWVALDRSDSRSMLQGETLIDHHHPTTRNALNAIRNLWLAFRVLRRERPDVIMSTGAAVAVPFFLVARLLRVPSVYVEVLDRIDTATLSGRLCYRLASCFVIQWDEQRRLYPRAVMVGPLLPTMFARGDDEPDTPDVGESVGDEEVQPADRRQRAVVVVAGTDHHPFDRIVDWVERWHREREWNGEVIVQYGGTTRAPATVDGRRFIPFDELQQLIATSAAVVTHGGPGSICDAWRGGRLPVVVPRERQYHEHVDDHQVLFTARLADNGAVALARTYEAFEGELDAAIATRPLDVAGPAVLGADPVVVSAVVGVVESVVRGDRASVSRGG